ncbi:MAG: discoidin domain-containing protein [Acidobacteria bacterium]|nr:discoidin domain-containing protein [Acidobacteriota bacterium]
MTTRGNRAAPWLLAACGYVALTVVFTWPLVVRLSSVLPHDLGDPILATWILWWNAHVTLLTERWWNAPYFWPTRGVMTFSEHLLGVSLLTTPLMRLGVSPVAAYNIAFLVTFPLSALGAHALAFRLTRRHDAGVIAGLIYGFNPYRTAQIAHIQVIWSFLMPFALATLHTYRDDARARWLALLGALVLAQALGNGYYLLYFPLLLGFAILWFFDVRTDLRRVAAIVSSCALALVPTVPVLLGYLRVHRALGFERGIGEIRVFSADLVSLTWTAPEVALWTARSVHTLPEQQLFFGLTAIALVAVTAVLAAKSLPAAPSPWPRVRLVAAILGGVFTGLALVTIVVGPWRIAAFGVTIATLGNFSKPFAIGLTAAAVAVLTGPRFTQAVRRRSVFGFYVFAAIALFILAMGPDPAVRQTTFFYKGPYAWLMLLPGFNAARAPARLGMLIALCVSAAAALGFARFVDRLPKPFARVAALLVVAGVLADSWIRGLMLQPVPDRVQAVERLTTDAPVIEVPLGNVESDLAAMYRSMYHRHPVVNGYGGYAPAHYPLLQFAFKTPREYGVAAFAGIGAATTVVVDERTADGAAWATLVARVPGATEIAHEAGRRVFAVPGAPVPSEELTGSRLPIKAVVTNTVPMDLARLTDGDRTTGWGSRALQRGDEVVTIDLGATRRVDGVTMTLGQFIRDFPRVLAIDTSADGLEWTTRPTSASLALAIAAARRAPREAPMPFRLGGVLARYIRLRQLGQDPYEGWAFAELAVYGN